MDLLGLTTTEAVRAFIGIDESSGELPDQLFVDLEIEDALKLELGTWLPVTLAVLLAGGDGSGSAADLAYTAARHAARAWCAMEVVQAAEISLAAKHSDGQNEFSRQAYKVADLLLRFGAVYARYKDMVLVNLGETATSSPSWMAALVRPDYDPVTNQ